MTTGFRETLDSEQGIQTKSASGSGLSNTTIQILYKKKDSDTDPQL